MVRLKDHSLSIGPAGTTWFQFLDGAIKSHRRHAGNVYRKVFQFLDGAIKSRQVQPEHFRAHMFQFLDGAIKSRPRRQIDGGIRGFNSLMVRLKVKVLFRFQILVCTFQFLDGAIKSKHTCTCFY